MLCARKPATVAVVLAFAWLGCGGDPAPQGGAGTPAPPPTSTPQAPATQPPPAVPSLAEAAKGLSPMRSHLADTAALVVERIRSLETGRDVTCWTSFRQLDNFIAAKSYSNFATLTKVAAAKALVHGV